MAVQNDGRNSTLLAAAVEAKTKGGRVTVVPRGLGYGIAATATFPTASGAGTSVATFRNNTSGNLIFIERIGLQLTTVTSFTTPNTTGRRVAIFRGAGATPSGGTQITPVPSKDSTLATSNVLDFRVSAGSAISTTGIVFEAQPFREIGLTHMGTAITNYDVPMEWHPTENSPIILQPGQLIALRFPVALDAGGVIQFTINIDWHESVAYFSSTAD